MIENTDLKMLPTFHLSKYNFCNFSFWYNWKSSYTLDPDLPIEYILSHLPYDSLCMCEYIFLENSYIYYYKYLYKNGLENTYLIYKYIITS